MAQDQTRDSKGGKIGYWVATGLLAAAMAAGGVFDLLGSEQIVEAMTHLGYPAHLATLLGIAKLLAVATILAPGFPRLKEWAYAGITIDLVGAAWSHAHAGDSVGEFAPAIIVHLGVLFTSYFLRPDSRRLPDRPRGS
jgi:uncharacterized membrane protein YphA (DoxX/SURF4 family)